MRSSQTHAVFRLACWLVAFGFCLGSSTIYVHVPSWVAWEVLRVDSVSTIYVYTQVERAHKDCVHMSGMAKTITTTLRDNNNKKKRSMFVVVAIDCRSAAAPKKVALLLRTINSCQRERERATE